MSFRYSASVHARRVGIEGRARFFPSQSISLRSPTFGFTETGSTGRTTDYSVLFTASVPLTMSDIRVKRDIVQLARLHNGIGLYRYRYNWSDQLYVGVMAHEIKEIVPSAVVPACRCDNENVVHEADVEEAKPANHRVECVEKESPDQRAQRAAQRNAFLISQNAPPRSDVRLNRRSILLSYG